MAKSALVTGASGDIGTAICEELSNSGFEVVGVDREPSVWTSGLSIDIRDEDLAPSLRSRYDLDHLTTIVHCAALQVIGEIHEHSDAVWLEAMHINVIALNSLVSSFRAELTKNRGSIVAIGSVHSISSRRGIGVYAVTKSALDGWVRASSLELGPNVRVNSVIPGAISSGALRQYIEAEGDAGKAVLENLEVRSPLRRIGTPQDVAHAVAFLASESASFITGQSLVVDGGATGLLGTEI